MKTINKFAPYILIPFLVLLIAGSNICCSGKNDKIPHSEYSSENKGEVISLTESNFDEKTASGVVLVDFWATWCRPCKMQAPIIEEVNIAVSGKALICKLDIDQNPSISARFGIQSIPTMILFKNGKAVMQFTGLTSKEDILSEMNKLFNQ